MSKKKKEHNEQKLPQKPKPSGPRIVQEGFAIKEKEKKDENVKIKKKKKKRYLVLTFSPYFGILRDMGYEFKRGIPTEVKDEDVEKLLGKHNFLKEVEKWA